MARTRATWATSRGRIESLLQEAGAAEYYDDSDFLMFWNQEKDLFEVKLHLHHEGWSVETYQADLTEDVEYYDLPESAGSLKNVYRVYPELGREIPILRNERKSAPISTMGVGLNSVPQARLVGNRIKIEPKPGETTTNGLKIEIEVATDEVSGDTSLLPIDWPVWSSTYLELRVAKRVIEAEELLDAGEGEARNRPQPLFYTTLGEWEGVLNEYLENRFEAPQFARPYKQGG